MFDYLGLKWPRQREFNKADKGASNLSAAVGFLGVPLMLSTGLVLGVGASTATLEIMTVLIAYIGILFLFSRWAADYPLFMPVLVIGTALTGALISVIGIVKAVTHDFAIGVIVIGVFIMAYSLFIVLLAIRALRLKFNQMS